MKEFISILLSLILVLAMFPGTALITYASSGTDGSLSWSLNSDTGVLTISGNGGRGENHYYDNTPWYSERSAITSVVVEDGVIAIGDYAFYNLTNLTSISLPNTLDTLGNHVFYKCTSLVGVALPENCTYYYSNIFEDCKNLKWAVLPKGNTTGSFSGKVPSGTFKGCDYLEEVYIGAEHTDLDSEVFYNCYNLKTLVWNSENISATGTNCFYGAPNSIQTIGGSLPDKTKIDTSGSCGDNMNYSLDIDTMALTITGSGDMNNYFDWQEFNYLITSLTFDTSDNYNISTSAFQNCYNISSLDLGDNVINIGWGAFMNCSSIKSITIPNTVENVWGCAFENCTNVETVNFEEGGTQSLYIREYSFKNLKNSTYWLSIPENAVFIGDEAFYLSAFNYIIVKSSSLTFGTNSFGDGNGGYSRFYGISGSGLRDFVNTGKTSGYNWFYYCLNDAHIFSTQKYEPSCIQEGYTKYICDNCDYTADTDFLGYGNHEYANPEVTGSVINYTCSVCGRTHLQYDATQLIWEFNDKFSIKSNPSQYIDYSAKYDINRDSYVNAKDYLLLIDLAKKENSLTNRQTTIDTSTTYQTMDGFGASACWWSQTVGNWENADYIASLLYSKEDGIGLNIYRYNLGAGSKGDSTMYIEDEKTYCFLQSDGTYNWDIDSGAMNELSLAQQANPNLKVTLFSNSAPVSMTINGHAYCTAVNDDGSYNQNLSEDNYDDFSAFIVACAEHFIDEGYNVTCVSPINEPEWSWACWKNSDGTYSMNQEGCNWTYSNAQKFYNDYMIPALQNSTKLNGKVELSVWESGQLNHSTYWKNFLPAMFSSSKSGNSNIRSYVNSLDTHSYWASTSDRTTVASQLTGSQYSSISKVKCTEYCQMSNDSNSGVYGLIQKEGVTNGLKIEYGLATANIIYEDLTILNATEWDWWTACGRGVYNDSLIYVNDNDHSDVQTSKRLWCLGNFSKFIDEGAKRVSVSVGSDFGSNLVTDNTYSWTSSNKTYTDKNNYLEQLAYQNPDGSVVVVYINNSDVVEHTTFGSSYSSFESYVTDETHNLEKFQTGAPSSTVTIPAKSVTTVVLK